MKLEQKASGLLLPVEKPKAPPKVYGPLEIDCDHERREASEAFTILLNLGACGGRSFRRRRRF